MPGLRIKWWPKAGLNCRHQHFQCCALPAELSGQSRFQRSDIIPHHLSESTLKMQVSENFYQADL